MNLKNTESQRQNPSMWSKARRDMGTPQGTNLASALLMCAIISIILEVVGVRVIGLPKSIVYPAIIIIDFVILVVAVIKISAMYQKAELARRDVYNQKFGIKEDIFRQYTEFKKSGGTGKKPTMELERGLTYEDAGVSIDTKEKAFKAIKETIRSTYRPEVLSDMGNFGGLFALDKNKYEEPILVSSNDSVGTKLKLAFMTGKHNTVGYDIVAHCADDILVQGAEPLFFLDYIGTSKVEPDVMVQLMEGLAAGCKDVGCALIGGETAELPSFYQPGEYDLAGTIVGIVEKKKLLTGETIKPGDRIIGIASTGLHTNGYSLARKIFFEVCGYSANDNVPELGITVGEELLKIHKSYVKPVIELLKEFNTDEFVIKGLAHITGGGMLDNIPRILPENCTALIEKGKWDILPVFNFLQEKGKVEENEMYRVFNMGIGMVVIVSALQAGQILNKLNASGEKVYSIGRIIEGNKTVLIR